MCVRSLQLVCWDLAQTHGDDSTILFVEQPMTIVSDGKNLAVSFVDCIGIGKNVLVCRRVLAVDTCVTRKTQL